ncbi:hypothetical protein BO79DRAFT_274346 [Aspergillus costaricaensis CBS 115574]|uniref:Uncharacterized protein n=1 Tax=Aspergillus costaricaensis CBS 115574 TaxID=1448317 RepID=A0ACD1I368_9EURO|nr:hypothetical protein BO79DRAFT_274346 [Aspergillus costaricaensis CBS 115574]RAK84917.1 hypothetical protein BO79DRAFT_274346 [Aspergillus costaricaensis CBS 115574]
MPNHEAHDTPVPTSPVCIAIWNFSSQWFLIPQGTGVIAIILHQLDYQFHGLRIISVIVWVYTIVLLALCVSVYLARIFMYPRHVARALRASMVEVSCLTSVSITFTTIIQMIALAVAQQWGAGWPMASYVLWWINTAMALTAVMGIPYIFVKLQAPGIKAVVPSVLLPLICALTSAAGGGVVCEYSGIGARLQVPTIIVAYLEVGVGIPLAMSFADVFIARLFEREFMPMEQVYQDMILCGPFGQGSFALLILGQVVRSGAFAEYNRGSFLTGEAAIPIGYASQLAGLLSWGYGTFWWGYAIISILHTAIKQPGGWRRIQYSLSAWSLVFPWGVYTNAAVQLGKVMDSPAFKVWSTALTLMLLILWIVNHIFTIKGLITGQILSLQHGWRAGHYQAGEVDKQV